MSHVVSALQCLLTDWFLSSASPHHHHQPPPARLLCGDQEAGSCELDRYSWADTGHTSRYLVYCGELISVSRYQRSYSLSGRGWAELGQAGSYVKCGMSIFTATRTSTRTWAAQRSAGADPHFCSSHAVLVTSGISISINNHDIIILDIYSFFVFTCVCFFLAVEY